MDVELKEWYHYSNETTSRIPPPTAIDAAGQCDKNFYPAECICDSTSNDDYQREIVFYVAAYKKYLQNATGQGQLNGLALLNSHRETEVSAI
jgi:hypothetical protein